VKVYPNQQLRSVSLQCYFRGQFSVFAELAGLQRELARRFPDLFVPNAQPGQAPALQPYELRGESEALRWAANQVAYVSYAYPGHEQFLAEALPLLSKALARFGIEGLERVAYVYDNEIGIAKGPDGGFALGTILDASTLPSWATAEAYQGFELNVTGRWPKGWKQTRVSLQDGGAVGALRMQINTVVTPAGPAAALAAAADAAHAEASATFEAMISDAFRRYLSGEEAGA
jgi:uncharacterized protein (TIGR04255 family)